VTAFVVVLYVYVGAAHKVALGLREKREDPRHSWQWYQRQFAVYGALPVRQLFGHPFSLWVGPRGKAGGAAPILGTEEHIRGWQELVRRYPGSMWADGAYYELAHVAAVRAAEAADRHAAAEACTYAAELAQHHPRSPYSELSLLDAARCALGMGSTEDAAATYDLLLGGYPGTDGAHEAGRELVRRHEQRGELPLALEDALRWSEAAPPEGKSEACLTAGSLLDELGRNEDADRLYRQGEQAAVAWLSLPHPADLSPAQHSAWVRKRGEVAADLEELRARLAAPSP
jgi:hypothetical protein